MESDPAPERQRRRLVPGILTRPVGPTSVARRFLLTYAVLLAAATLAIGIWVGQQIEDGVLNRTAAVTALYIHSFVAPQVQSLTTEARLTPSETSSLGRVLQSTELGQKIVGFRIWSHDGTVLYSPIPGMTGQKFALAGDRALSFEGQVTVDMSDLTDPENIFERQQHYSHLVEMYVPILQDGSGQVLAVAEFYQVPDEIDAEVTNARIRSWALVLLAAIASFLVVAAMALRASNTIAGQQSRLHHQVDELSGLLSQVEDLNVRIRQAGAQAEAIAAQEGRRISADLHDGPGQALALALLQFEDLEVPSAADDSAPAEGSASASAGATASASSEASASASVEPAAPASAADGGSSASRRKLDAARDAIADALRELRQIAAGLRLPELAPLSIREVAERAIHDHERRTDLAVSVDLHDMPSAAPLAVKIGLFRALQETLSNATRHGRGIDVRVRSWGDGQMLHLEVSDGGPGFTMEDATSGGGLGLPGIRERTALVGGSFEIASTPGHGTTVHLAWPLADGGGSDIAIAEGSTG